IAGYFHMAEQVFNDEEMVNRAAALQHFGIEGKVKEQGEQTVADRNRIVVLPMAESNQKAIVSIYEAAGFKPPEGVELLSVYATRDPTASIPDAFGKGPEFYFKCVESILDYVPKAVDRALVTLD
ncbi:hypothetical protein GOV07_02010, partial [Candidatus Woesearchaeota archaeon]|nr:hypothetical protein [Candidatus Woesearchaeota archaeon]